jgi:6-phosphogluconolactonase
METSIREFDSGPEAAAAAAVFILEKLGETISSRGRASILLPGGSAPKLVNSELIRLSHTAGLDSVQWYFGDERAVKPDSPDSNFRMQMETLLGPLSIDPEQIHRIRGELGAAEAADEYRKLLEKRFCGFPMFDLVMLGLGPDGHTASLFPGSPELSRTDNTVVPTAVSPMEPHVERITVTLPVINAAKSVLFFTGYRGKQQMIDRLRTRKPGGYPFEMVIPHSGPAEWFIYRS